MKTQAHQHSKKSTRTKNPTYEDESVDGPTKEEQLEEKERMMKNYAQFLHVNLKPNMDIEDLGSCIILENVENAGTSLSTLDLIRMQHQEIIDAIHRLSGFSDSIEMIEDQIQCYLDEIRERVAEDLNMIDEVYEQGVDSMDDMWRNV